MVDHPVRHLVLSHYHVRKEGERDHGQEQHKIERPVPFPYRPAIHRPYGHQAVDRGHKVDGKAYSAGNCPESPGLSEGKEQDHENNTGTGSGHLGQIFYPLSNPRFEEYIHMETWIF